MSILWIVHYSLFIIRFKKGLYACKPDPVLPRGSLYHLSAMWIAPRL